MIDSSLFDENPLAFDMACEDMATAKMYVEDTYGKQIAAVRLRWEYNFGDWIMRDIASLIAQFRLNPGMSDIDVVEYWMSNWYWIEAGSTGFGMTLISNRALMGRMYVIEAVMHALFGMDVWRELNLPVKVDISDVTDRPTSKLTAVSTGSRYCLVLSPTYYGIPLAHPDTPEEGVGDPDL